MRVGDHFGRSSATSYRDAQRVPAEIQEAIQEWVTDHFEDGRESRCAWNVNDGCYQILTDTSSDDPRMQHWQAGLWPHRPVMVLNLRKYGCGSCGRLVEDDASHCPSCGKTMGHTEKARVQRWISIDVRELGVGGVVNWLDRTNLASGRAGFTDIMQVMMAHERQQVGRYGEIRAEIDANTRLRTRDAMKGRRRPIQRDFS